MVQHWVRSVLATGGTVERDVRRPLRLERVNLMQKQPNSQAEHLIQCGFLVSPRSVETVEKANFGFCRRFLTVFKNV